MRPEEARKQLESAIETLKDLDLPDQLEVVAFERLLDAYGLPRSTHGPSVDDPQPGLIQQAERGDAINGGDGALRLIAQTLHSEFGSVAQIYDMQDGGIQLILRRDMLPDPTKKAVSMRHVGLLVVAGRQAGAIEEWTPVGVLRDECREVGVLDSSNFATEIGKLGFKVKGAGAKREVRATRHHLSEASDLIAEIVKDAGP
jgi:hypothetical protein